MNQPTEGVAPIGPSVSFPVLVDAAQPWALRGGWLLFWWSAAPVALMSASGAVLAIRASQLGGTDPLAGCGSLVLLLAFYPLAALVWIVCTAALTAGAFRRLEGQPMTPGEAFAWVLQPSVALTLLVAAAAVAVAGLFTFFALFLGGVLVLLMFAFLVPVMIDQGPRGLGALSASARLAWRNPTGRFLDWPLIKLLALVLLQFVMGAALQLLVSLPYQVAVQVLSLRDLMAGELPDLVSVLGPLIWIQVPVQVLASLVQTWVVYYVAFALGMLYRDLRARRTAADLEQEIDRLLHPVSPTPPAGDGGAA